VRMSGLGHRDGRIVYDCGNTSDSPVIAFAGGGTGGHLYPALAIADALRKRLPDVTFLFFGTERSIDSRIVGGADYELVRQHLPPIRKVPWSWPGTLMGLRQSTLQCRARFHCGRPMVVIGTGGLASLAPIREARRANVPTAILNPDAVLGRANRLLSTLVDIVFVQWPDTVSHLSRAARVQVSGCPVRPEFNTATRQAGIERFDLDGSLKTLLVTGASQGAHSINQAVIANIELFESLSDWQVLHLTGDRDYQEVCDAYKDRPVCARVYAYTDQMAEALAAADLVVARAGASTLAEITAVGRPAILMPYPFHRDMHQLANARCLVRASAARIVTDAVESAVNGPELRAVLEQLMCEDQARQQMAEAARRIGHGDAGAVIAAQVLALAHRRGTIPSGESVEQTC